MTDYIDRRRARGLDLVKEVDQLSEETKTLALNLAIYLAKARTLVQSEELARIEPEFIRLINGTVRVIGEVAVILDAARNKETMVYDIPGDQQAFDRIESGLRAILEQCSKVMASLARARDITA